MSWLRSRSIRAVLMALVGAMVLSGCDFSVYSLPLPGGADLGSHPYSVRIEFRDVLDLVPQSSVKVDDVTVGRVDDVKAQGYHALVTIKLRGNVKLPDNAEATIRQTSLLGEKFVSLAPPASGASQGRLSNNDLIPLSRSGRNPEVEEVLGALSLVLNGGGVAQLKTIASELNKTLGGREPDVRSVLSQLNVLMKQLDTNKATIVHAIESLNRLAIALNKQKPAIVAALDQLPRAVASINRQRDDLVKMLRALANLSSIGTRVILQSKTATINSLQSLTPTLTKLSQAGSSFPRALQVFLTYPFVDAVVGTNPAQARNLHVGDYTNLSVNFDLSLNGLGIGQVCSLLPQLQTLPGNLCKSPVLQSCLTGLLNTDVGSLPTTGVLTDILNQIQGCTAAVVSQICSSIPTGTPLSPVLSKLTAVCDALQKIIPPTTPGIPLPPIPPIPGVPGVTALTRCLNSGKPMGTACAAINPLTIASRCTARTRNPKPAGYNSPTCQRYRQLHLGITSNGQLGRLPLGGSGGSGGGTGTGTGGVLPGLGTGGLTGANRTAPGPRTGATSRATAAHSSDLTAMLAWGMVQR